ncbi:MAG: TGS domain-containing protein [Deltaproteobacteria bacterium]|nr:TGS domain-containing protein [Deltaproteobacteria bacterium]
MPANLPPHYYAAEQQYREAKTPEEKIEALEEMIAIMPKHKGTDKLKADLRRRIARHRDESQQKKGASKFKTAYSIQKEGAAQVAIIGFPNTGKSSLVSLITNAAPEVADYPHTTHKPMPGMAVYENIQFQLIDTPPVTKDFTEPLFADLIRRTDVVMIFLDLEADPLQQLEDTLEFLASFRIFAEGLPVPENILKKPAIKTTLLVANKMDSTEREEDFNVFCELSPVQLPRLGISAKTGKNIPALLSRLYDLSKIIRVYTKSPGKEADPTKPFVLPAATTLGELAAKVHKDFAERMKYAKVWGTAVHDGQMVQRDYVLQDGDIVEIHI